MGLRKLRLAKGYTLHKLAELSGVNYQKIWQIERSVINPENIALKTAIKLSKALGCSPEELMKPDEEPALITRVRGPPLLKTHRKSAESPSASSAYKFYQTR